MSVLLVYEANILHYRSHVEVQMYVVMAATALLYLSVCNCAC